MVNEHDRTAAVRNFQQRAHVLGVLLGEKPVSRHLRADHARRGSDAVTAHVIWAGTTVAIGAAVVLTLVFTRHPIAPVAIHSAWIVLGRRAALSGRAPHGASCAHAMDRVPGRCGAV